MKKIAIAGQIRSGKNTVSDYLIKQLDLHPIAFAEGITEVIERYFPEAFEVGKPRGHYLTIGQAFRKLDPDYWVKSLDKHMKDYIYVTGGGNGVVITDLRQPNEYEYVKREEFIVIKVEADFAVRKDRAEAVGDKFKPEDFYHATEGYMSAMPYDYLITNNTTLADLYKQIDYVIKDLGGDFE